MKKINDEYIMVDDIDAIVRSWKSYVCMPNPEILRYNCLHDQTPYTIIVLVLALPSNEAIFPYLVSTIYRPKHA